MMLIDQILNKSKQSKSSVDLVQTLENQGLLHNS